MSNENSRRKRLSAIFYRSIGLFPFPLRSPEPGVKGSGKSPRYSGWQKIALNATYADHRYWMANGWNLAFSLGPSRLVLLDADTPEADEWVLNNLPLSPWRTRTSRGHHYYFRLAEGQVAPSNGVHVHPLGIDRRSDGGSAVAPGSVHWTGVIYEAEGDWNTPINELPVYNPEWFPLAQDLPAPTVLPMPRNADAMKVKRAAAYLKAIPPAVQGQGGDFHTYKAACRLVKDFALDKDEALSLLSEWNTACCPPWEMKDLERKVDSALRSKGIRGQLLRVI